MSMISPPTERETMLSKIRELKGELDLIKSVPAQNINIQQKIMIELNNQLEKLLNEFYTLITK